MQIQKQKLLLSSDKDKILLQDKIVDGYLKNNAVLLHNFDNVKPDLFCKLLNELMRIKPAHFKVVVTTATPPMLPKVVVNPSPCPLFLMYMCAQLHALFLSF
jgi:hypothetical protein